MVILDGKSRRVISACVVKAIRLDFQKRVANMPNLKRQKLILVEVLIPTMVDKIILWLFLLKKCFF